MYWRDIGVSPEKIVQDTYRVNRQLGRPVYPIGQTWNNPGNGQLVRFQRAAKKAGAHGVSWRDWSQTSNKSWNELSHQAAYTKAHSTKKPQTTSSKGQASTRRVRHVLGKLVSSTTTMMHSIGLSGYNRIPPLAGTAASIRTGL